MSNDAKLKYLDHLQMNIDRMSRASFAYKAWAVSGVTALFASAVASEIPDLALVAIFPIFIFWWLDSYYLEIERRFVKLYNIAKDEEVPSFNMTPSNSLKSKYHILSTAFSFTILLLYVPLVLFVVVIYAYLK